MMGFDSDAGAPLGSSLGSARWPTMIAGHADVRGDGAHEGHQVDTVQARAREGQHRQAHVRVDGRATVAGEVLGHGHDAAALHALDVGRAETRHQRRVGAVGAIADDRVVGVGEHVEHRREVHVEAHPGQLTSLRGAALAGLQVTRVLAAEGLVGARVVDVGDGLDRSALLVDGADGQGHAQLRRDVGDALVERLGARGGSGVGDHDHAAGTQIGQHLAHRRRASSRANRPAAAGPPGPRRWSAWPARR